MQVKSCFQTSTRAVAVVLAGLFVPTAASATADQNGAASRSRLPAATTTSTSTNSTAAIPDFVIKYAPLVHLHSADPFRPSDLLTHLQHTTPQTEDYHPVITGLDTITLDNLEKLNQFGNRGGVDVFLTSNNDVAAQPMAEWLLGTEPDLDGPTPGMTRNATPCVVVIVEKTERELDAFYFYFYSYNQGGNISQVWEPIDRIVKLDDGENKGMHFGDHVGDWEHNMIRFKDGKPTGIYYSQHISGAAYSWGDRKISKRDGRPIVYSAYGSHATYPTIGNNTHDSALIDWCDAGPIWDPVLSAYFLYFEPSASTVTPLTSSSPTSFFYFTGRWGDQQYLDVDPRQRIVPKFGLRRFQTGPTGPRAKHLVRKGLMPEGYPPRKTWLQWRVEWVIALWPCCIRGWRKWVSVGVVLGVVLGVGAGLVVGLRFVVGRLKGRKGREGYEKVGGEEELEEVDGGFAIELEGR